MIVLSQLSPAKLNLTLRVLGVRADGFHEIESLVAQIELCDRVSVNPAPDGEFTLACDDSRIPLDSSNLALKAACALADATGCERGAHIDIAKRIPPGAGLGGGSSNAATTLVLLNQLWQTGLNRPRLVEIGAAIGSDVPLFLCGPWCVIRGRGELVQAVPPGQRLWTALILPELHCSTSDVYAAWDRMRTHPRRPPLEQVLAARGSAAGLMELLYNDLEGAAFETAGELGRLAEEIEALAGVPVRLTGSGSGLFRLFDDPGSASRLALDVGMRLDVRAHVASLRTR